jgi:uncharacterized membrane protein YczE
MAWCCGLTLSSPLALWAFGSVTLTGPGERLPLGALKPVPLKVVWCANQQLYVSLDCWPVLFSGPVEWGTVVEIAAAMTVRVRIAP